jgi:DHA1 family tetracycline resistance protein-like MFS transporter
MRKASTLFIFITLLIDVTGIGLIIPVLPKLIREMTNQDYSVASSYTGYLIAVYALMQFVFSPILGGLSDQYGRRPVLLFSLFGFGLDHILLIFAPTIGWLFLGRVIAGITGGSITTASAYIADVSPPDKRAQNFGLIGVAFGVGFIIGPAVGGWLGDLHVRLPFLVAAILTLLNWLYGYFVLPESLSLENRRTFDIKRANPIGSLLNLRKYPVILGLIACMICVQIAGQVHPSTWALFTMKEFSWTGKQVGFSLTFVGLMVALVQGGLIRMIVPKLGETKSIYLGLTFYALGFFLFSLANQGWMMYAIMIPFALSGIAGPTLQGLISKQVQPNEQGELQGALTSLVSLTAIFGPIIHTQLFSYFSKENPIVYFPGAAFFFGSVMAACALVIFWNYFKDKKPEPKQSVPAQTIE